MINQLDNETKEELIEMIQDSIREIEDGADPVEELTSLIDCL